jgi:two-component system sensor histidine kinase PilS (NtrC family)
MADVATTAPSSPPAQRDRDLLSGAWRSLLYFNAYRLVVAALLLVAATAAEQLPQLDVGNRAMFLGTASAYVFFALASFASISARQPGVQLQLGLQVCADIVFMALLMHAGGGIGSGLGLLLLANLAGAAIISGGRLALFYASLASLAVLLTHAYEVVTAAASPGLFVQAGLLSIGFFATAWLAHSLAQRAVASERLAEQRQVDLASQALVSQLVMQDMQDGVIVVDSRGAVRQINSRAEQLVGPLAKAAEVPLREYSPPIAARLARWHANPDGGSLEPIRTVLSNTLTAARFVPVGPGGGQGVVVFVEDLTRVQAQVQQLKLASLGRLTANIAHEIRNPLSAINHATELLQEEPGMREHHGRLLQIIHDNVQRLDRMVQDVLRLNRRDRAVRETFLLGDFLRTFAAEFAQIEKVPGDVLRVRMELEPTVVFDRSHLNQVMWNLCRNALRYCQRKPGSVRIEGAPHSSGDSIAVRVLDDGPGVDEALRAHLFEPFFTTNSAGTGLGLYIARELCEANGATLGCEESEGPGARFTILIKGAVVRKPRRGRQS